MSDGEALLVVLAFLYLSDCFAWLKKSSVALVSTWGRDYRVNAEAGLLGNSHGRLLPLNPLPPFGRLYVAHPVPISLSHEGICQVNLHSVVPGASLNESSTAVPFEQVTSVSHDGAILRVNNARFVKCGSPAQALALAELIREAKAAKPHKREHLIREFLRGHFSRKAAASRLDVVRPYLPHLVTLSTAFFLFLFVAVPWMAMRTSASAVLIRGAVAAVVLAGAVGFIFYRAHSKLFPKERFERISGVIKMVLCPPMAIQAVNHLTIPVLATFHPVVVMSILQPRNAQPFLEGFLRRQRFPVATGLSDSAALGVCQWFGQLQSEMVTEFFKETHPDLLKSAFAAPSKEGNAKAYCPRCLAQYESLSAECPDCPGVRVVPFETSTTAHS